MSKIQRVKHITVFYSLLCPAIYSDKQNTVSTLEFNKHFFNCPLLTCLLSYHASLCVALCCTWKLNFLVFKKVRPKKTLSHFPITESWFLYSTASPRPWIFLHQAWDKWKWHPLIFISGQNSLAASNTASSKSKWIKFKFNVSPKIIATSIKCLNMFL